MKNFCILERTTLNLYRSLVHQTQSRMATNSPSSLGNRLKNEKSPYLLQHASNPVDWYPWGEDAFKAAKDHNKLIFLSVGYSTCHWCHVMERESFENQEIAKIMNEHFINVKVDREERPDVDKVYMTFVTSLSGGGGWPMSVWMTPDLKPVYGGTYFPPTDRYYGRPGFSTILKSIANQWEEDKDKFNESSSKILEVLQRQSKLESGISFSHEESVIKAFTQLVRMYEPDYGGFSQSPKFPQPSNFNFLFAYHALNPGLDDAKKGLEMCLHTLKMMDKGGIHDHICQGFARYSTDSKWHVPHFEKMLYDQAQLVFSYLEAYLATKEERCADVVRDILTYVMRDLSHPSGGFYSAEDADSLPTFESKEKREGAFCVWTYEEIKTHLSSHFVKESSVTLDQIFCFHFSIAEGGNVDPYQDPHDELKNQNVLLVHGDVESTASEFEISLEDCKSSLEKARDILFKVREKRPRPHLDDKMLTAWNGMMFGAMAEAGAVLANNDYLERATKCANFIKDSLWTNGTLKRAAYRIDEESISLGSNIDAFADDYAWVIKGLLYLYDASLDEEWLLWAEQLQEKQNELFWDSESGGYFLSRSDDGSILLRLKEDQDGAEPSVNSVSSGNLILLSRILNRPDFEEKAKAIFKAFSARLQKIPVALPEMVKSLLLHTTPAEQIIISGDRSCQSVKEMLRIVHSTCIKPNRFLLMAGMDTKSAIYNRHEILQNFVPKSPEGIAYICKDFTCALPIKSPEELLKVIQKSCPAPCV